MIKPLTREECARLLLASNNPTVVMHRRPDGDTAGTAAALIEALTLMGKTAGYICADPLPERLAFILRDMERRDTPTGDIICVDVASTSQLGSLAPLPYEPLLTVDHHAHSEPFSRYYTVPEASSAAEALYDILEILIEEGKITPTLRLGEALYTAISSDTGRFCYSNATAKTHSLAARLINLGVDTALINHRLFNAKSRSELLAEGFIASNIKTAMGGRIAYAAVTLTDLCTLGVTMSDFDTAVDVVRSLIGVEIALVVKECEEGCFRIQLRALSHNVASVAEKFGGGGHTLAAGSSVSAGTAEEVIDRVLPELSALFGDTL